MYFTFFCKPPIIDFYAMILLGLAIFGIIFPHFSIFHSPHFRKVRIWVFVVMSALPIAMWVHSVYIFGLHDSSSFLFKFVCLSYSLFLLGLFFYGSRWPECKYPGEFDIWVFIFILFTYQLGSHQIWHVLAFLGAYSWYYGIAEYAKWRLTVPCS